MTIEFPVVFFARAGLRSLNSPEFRKRLNSGKFSYDKHLIPARAKNKSLALGSVSRERDGCVARNRCRTRDHSPAKLMVLGTSY